MKFRSILAGALALVLSTSIALAQTGQGSSPLTGPKGGTNNAFMQFTGPATSLKTYTLPNASDTISTLGAIQTYSAAKTFSALLSTAAINATSNSATAFAVGRLGATTPALHVDASTGSSITGIKITAQAAGNGVNINSIGETNVPILLNAAGNGTISLNSNSGTGVINFYKTTHWQGSTSGSTSVTPAAIASGAWTLPSTTDTFVGNALAATLTNKTFNCASNICTVRIGSDVTGLGTNVATALANTLNASSGLVGFSGALGTPTSGTLTNATGLPVSTGISGLGSGIATWLATPSSANLRSAITDESGAGNLVFNNAPSIDTLSLTGVSNNQGTLKLSAFVTSTQITANQNNYTATDGSNTCTTKLSLRVSSDASRNVTGLSCSQAEGDVRIIHNVGAQNIVLTNQDTNSTAGNRFLFGGDMTLGADTSVTVRYDGVTSRWRAITTPGAGGGGGGVTSVGIVGAGLTANSGTCTITTSGTCTLTTTASVQSDQETGTSTTTTVVPGVQQYHQSAVKAWVRFNASSGTPTIVKSYNVTSLTDNGVGDTTINFTIPFSDALYAPVCWGDVSAAAQGTGRVVQIVSMSTSALRILTTTVAAATGEDLEFVMCQVMGDQ